MIMTTIEESEFAKKAAEHFAKNPKHWSFGDFGEGNFLALKFGLNDDCVLVLKQDEYFEPTNYQNIIKEV